MRIQQFWALLSLLGIVLLGNTEAAQATRTVCIIPIRDDIATPITYLVRRGVKMAMEAKADAIILDMETNGGRLDSTEEIIKALDRFPGLTVTYVNRKAFSAGAFISVATQKIYMAPQSVIGAAAPMMMGPGGGVEAMPEAVEAKMTSGVRALVRTSAEKNGHNVEVIEAMIDRTKEVEIEGEVINEKGQILTLTNVQAEKNYGGKPLLSLGTVGSVDELIGVIGYSGAKILRVEATGAERLASFLTAIGPLLLLAGIVGVYIEMKTPGFGIPGIVGLIAFILYFLGGYVAGLSGLEWTVVFILGLALFILELFVFPGTFVVGLIGGAMMLAALVMAMVDFYPGMPTIPSFGVLRDSLFNVTIVLAVAMVLMMFLSRFLLKTPLYRRMIDSGTSGVRSDKQVAEEQRSYLGEVGVTLSPLRPGGKAKFGESILDVVSNGEMIPRSARVRIVAFSGREPIVESAETR